MKQLLLVSSFFLSLGASAQYKSLPDSVLKRVDINNFSKKWKADTGHFRADATVWDSKKDSAFFKNGINIAQYSKKQIHELLGKPDKRNHKDGMLTYVYFFGKGGWLFSEKGNNYKWVFKVMFTKGKVIKVKEGVLH